QRALRRLHREKVQRGQGEDRERRDPSSLKVDLGQSPQLLWTKTPAGLVVGPSSSDCLLLLWHSASLRCAVKFRTRSERSGRGERAARCPAILTIHFARRRDIGAIRTIAKKRSLAVACRTRSRKGTLRRLWHLFYVRCSNDTEVPVKAPRCTRAKSSRGE